jgi:hydroxymethylbilane synthase
LKELRIATRQSPLALWQARHVAERLRRAHPGLRVSLVEMSTEGDRFLQSRLAERGGKGLFVKEIEQAVLDGRAEIAVHSLKDMTSALPQELCIAAVPAREDPRDAWVSPSAIRLANLPRDAAVATSSLRRSCQLLERRPDLRIVNLRGNVQTRLRKTAEQQLAGTVLALAGLRRLGLEREVTEILEPEVSLPAVGQGVLAIECSRDEKELRATLQVLEDPDTRAAVIAERAFLATLEGGCSVPLAAYAQLSGDQLRLRGLIGRPDGGRVVRGERVGPRSSAERIGEALAASLLEQGGREILSAL